MRTFNAIEWKNFTPLGLSDYSRIDEFGDTIKKIAPLFPGSTSYILSFDVSGVPISRDVKSLFWNDFIQSHR